MLLMKLKNELKKSTDMIMIQSQALEILEIILMPQSPNRLLYQRRNQRSEYKDFCIFSLHLLTKHQLVPLNMKFLCNLLHFLLNNILYFFEIYLLRFTKTQIDVTISTIILLYGIFSLYSRQGQTFKNRYRKWLHICCNSYVW